MIITGAALRKDARGEGRDYTLLYNSVWITVKNISVHIIETDEGVVVDLWPLRGESPDDNLIASVAATFNAAYKYTDTKFEHAVRIIK